MLNKYTQKMANRLPINRLNKYFSEEEFDFQLELGLEYLEVINMEILLYKIDLEKMNVDKLYGEKRKGNLRFHPPKNISVIVKFEESTNTSYNKDGKHRYEEYGNLIVHVNKKTLTDLETDFSYGDYVSYQISEELTLYFEVSNNAAKAVDNDKTFGGYKPYWKTIVCTPVNIENINFE